MRKVYLKCVGQREEDIQSQYRVPDYVVQRGRQMWLAAMAVAWSS